LEKDPNREVISFEIEEPKTGVVDFIKNQKDVVRDVFFASISLYLLMFR